MMRPATRTTFRGSRTRRLGMSMVEIMIVMALFAVVFLASMGMMEGGRKLSNATLEITTVEDLAQQMLFKIEHELANASGFEPIAVLSADLGGTDTAQLVVDSTVGFPPTGTVIVGGGTPEEERISYQGLLPGPGVNENTFLTLTRGEECTQAASHSAGGVIDPGATVMWTGLAVPLVQVPPPVNFDGIVMETGQQIFFRGDGTGFSYRVPVDPAGGNDYVVGDDLNWGADVMGVGPTLTGWCALYFQPKTVFDESETGEDVNDDGDSADVFEVGQIRMVKWDRAAPLATDDIGLGPSAVIQERCNRGGDLDNDGFDDPLFFWNKDTNELHIRLFVLGTTMKEVPIVREVESVTFLRNEPELD